MGLLTFSDQGYFPEQQKTFGSRILVTDDTFPMRRNIKPYSHMKQSLPSKSAEQVHKVFAEYFLSDNSAQ